MSVSGVPNIRVIIREPDDENLLVDVPNLTVRVLQDDSYNVNVTPPVVVSVRTGSYNRFADVALLAYTASYVSGSGVIAEFATSASYAEKVNQNFTGSVLVNGLVSASSITGSFKGDGSQLTGIVTDLRITGSNGTAVIELKTEDLSIIGNNGIETTISGNTVTIDVPHGLTASLYGTASVADGIDVIFAGVFETGSAGVIIPTPSGGLSYITSASYALTASYFDSNTWDSLLNKPEGLVSSSVQVFYFPVQTAISASYAVTASYALNGGGGTSGTSGTSGTAGSSGTSGTAGSSGTSGSSGTAGSSGTSGVTPSIPTGTVSSSVQLTALGFVSSSTINTIQTITSASYAGITPVSGTLYIIID